MKILFAFCIFCLSLPLGAQTVPSPQAPAQIASEIKRLPHKTVIFVFDVTQSTRHGGVFTQERAATATLLRQGCSVGDRVILLKFGTGYGTVFDQTLAQPSEIDSLIDQIPAAPEPGRGTNIRWPHHEALKLIARDRLCPAVVVLLTDSFNDRPDLSRSELSQISGLLHAQGPHGLPGHRRKPRLCAAFGQPDTQRLPAPVRRRRCPRAQWPPHRAAAGWPRPGRQRLRNDHRRAHGSRPDRASVACLPPALAAGPARLFAFAGPALVSAAPTPAPASPAPGRQRPAARLPRPARRPGRPRRRDPARQPASQEIFPLAGLSAPIGVHSKRAWRPCSFPFGHRQTPPPALFHNGLLVQQPVPLHIGDEMRVSIPATGTDPSREHRLRVEDPHGPVF